MSGPGLPSVPARVQARIVALTAQVLPQVAPLPPALRKVVAFAPARRAPRIGAALLEIAAQQFLGGRAAGRGERDQGERPISHSAMPALPSASASGASPAS